MSEYKRGTETINGRRYGFYPDGSRFRIYEDDTPFITLVDVLAAIYEQLWYSADADAEIEKGRQLTIFDMIHLAERDGSAPRNDGVKHILTTFSGYDSQLMAADVLKERHPGFRWDCVGWSDIDRYACEMHNLVFPQYADKALGDITKIDWNAVKDSMHGEEIDLFTYSSPCQDISQAGRQMGLKEGSGSRSALLWNVSDAVEILRPKFLLQENVAALVSRKFMPDFQKWLQRLESLGYVNVWARLNAKNYGVPQNRDRVFCLSMREDVAFNYQFPKAVPLTRHLEDVLEERCEERFFLKDDSVDKFLRANNKDNAVFVTFPLAPTHEDAMFIKTWMHRWITANNGWEMTPEALDDAVRMARDNDFPADWQHSAEMKDKSFVAEYNVNMERK